MSKTHKQRDEVYAVIRVDEFHDEETPIEHRIIVKEIVASQELAQREVERLNHLNSDKQCRYFWQMTRLFPNGQCAGPPESGDDHTT